MRSPGRASLLRPDLLLGWCGLLLAGCGAAEPDAADPTAAPAPIEAPSELCAPLVSGCGCAYQCALGRARADGRYDVTHDYQDSRVDEAALERRCFDAAGHAYPGPTAEATRCLDVFSDLGACGGECIPSTQFLDCVLSEGRCAPR